jgi:hypothetical protein
MAREIIPSQYMEGDRKESLTAIPEPSRRGSGGYPSLDPSRFPRPRRGLKLRRRTRRPRTAWPGAASLRPPLHSLPPDYLCRLSPPVAVGPCALGLGSRWQTRRSRRPRRRQAALPASACLGPLSLDEWGETAPASTRNSRRHAPRPSNSTSNGHIAGGTPL